MINSSAPHSQSWQSRAHRRGSGVSTSGWFTIKVRCRSSLSRTVLEWVPEQAPALPEEYKERGSTPIISLDITFLVCWEVCPLARCSSRRQFHNSVANNNSQRKDKCWRSSWWASNMKLSCQCSIKRHDLADLHALLSAATTFYYLTRCFFPSVTKRSITWYSIKSLSKKLINVAGNFHFKLTFKESFHTLF